MPRILARHPGDAQPQGKPQRYRQDGLKELAHYGAKF